MRSPPPKFFALSISFPTAADDIETQLETEDRTTKARGLIIMIKTIQLLFALTATAQAFVLSPVYSKQSRFSSLLFTSSSDVAAPSISGEELETMMTEWDTPMVIDAYATWCGYV